MAPMIDMIFLLLIFFLVAAKWRPKEDFLPMQLAAAGFGVQSVGKPEPLLIQISQGDTGCRVQIGPSYVADIPAQNPEPGLATLIEKTRQCLLDQKRYASDPVEIVCDPDVKWENLARIYNVFVGIGLNDITFRLTEESTDDSSR
jgi:biopolymer transport protein ExbD